MKQDRHYMNVLSPGPLIIVRVPWPMPPWRSGILKGLTAVMRVHGLKQKDISSIEGLVPRPDQEELRDEKFVDRLNRAFDGDASILPEFWLYDWRDGAFRVARVGLP